MELAESEPGRYRVATLAELTGTSTRTIREYQDRGLLAPPQRNGRVVYYNDEHRARLGIISRMLTRGYTIASIKELLDAWNSGLDLAQVLGLSIRTERSRGLAPQ